MLLVVSAFLLIFAIAFVAVLLTLRAPAEQRQMQDRVRALLPATTEGKLTQQLETLVQERVKGRSIETAKSFQNAAWLRRLEQLVYQSKGIRTVRKTLTAVLAAGIFGLLLTEYLTGMPPLAVVAGILLGSLPLLHLHQIRRKRLMAFESALPDCIDICSRAIRAGHSLVGAIGMVAEQAVDPARSEFADVFNKQNYGLPIRDALLEMLERVPSADLRVFVTGILVQKDTGGNLTEIFDHIVLVIRERIRIKGEVLIQTAQGRMTGWVLTLLPVALLLVINVINPGYSRPMFDDPLGRRLMYLGAGMLLIGAICVRRIVNGIEV